jgi:hypothetical protein
MSRRLALLVAGAALTTAAPASAEPAVGVLANAGNTLVTFDTASPGSYTSVRPITGLQAGERIVGVDFRSSAPDAPGLKLNAVGVTQNGGADAARVYTIDAGTGAATLVSAAPVPFTDGDVYAIDFNPVADRIRVVNDGDANARLNPITGGLAATDTTLSPAGRAVNAIAYDRVDTDPATLTTLYGISATADSLVRIGGPDSIPSPNSGALTTIGALGVTADDVAMDISPTGIAYAGLDSGLYTVNLTTGAATLVGATPAPLRGLAIVPAATVAFGAAGFTQPENAGAATISLTRGGSLNGTAAVDYTAGEASGRVTFASGETSKTFSVPVTDDKLDNTDRRVTLTLRAADALVSAGAAATLTIADDDPAPDTKAPKATIKAPPSTTRSSLTSKGVKATITVNEAAKLEVSLEGTPKTAVLSAAYGLTLASKTVNATGKKSVTLKPTRKLVGRPRRAFKVRIKVVATDAAGNRSTTTRTLTVKR